MKLNHFAIRNKTYDYIASFLTGTQYVVLDGQSLSATPFFFRRPTTVLGPLLFLIFINDMPFTVISTSRLFADDSSCIEEYGQRRTKNATERLYPPVTGGKLADEV